MYSLIATRSVPPVDAPMLKRIAEPKAGNITAKASSNKGSSVIGPLMGTSISKRFNDKEKRRLPYKVLFPNFRPRTRYPMISNNIFTTRTIVPELIAPLKALLSIIASPVTPPIAKLFGNLKKYTPIVTKRTPRVTRV